MSQRAIGDGQSFQSLINALVAQYEKDVAEAARQAMQGMANAGFATPKTPASVQKTPVAAQGMPGMVEEDLDTIALPEEHQNQREERSAPGLKTAFATDAGDLPGAVGIVPAASSQKKADEPQKLQLAPVPVDNADDRPKARRSSIKAEPMPDTPLSLFVQSSKFDKLSAGLLILNSIFIGIQVEQSFQLETPVSIKIIDYIFCVLFIVELAVRIYGFGCRHFLMSPDDQQWNIFDSVIVAISTVDTLISIVTDASGTAEGGGVLGNISALRVLRVVRIVRVLRIIRVLKFFRDLRILMSAIVTTIKTAVFAFVLIGIIIYMFSIALCQMVSEHATTQMREKQLTDINDVFADPDDETLYFYQSLPSCWLTLFMTIAGGIDWKDAYVPLQAIGPLEQLIFMMFVCLMVLCVMNVLLGIFCQAALDSAANDRENVIQNQLQDRQRFVDTLKDMFYDWDENGDGKCSYQEFSTHLNDETTQALLSSLEIEGRDAIALFEMLDTDGSGGVDLQEFVTGCITMRGGSKAIHVEKISSIVQVLQGRFEHLENKVEDMNVVLKKQDANRKGL